MPEHKDTIPATKQKNTSPTNLIVDSMALMISRMAAYITVSALLAPMLLNLFESMLDALNDLTGTHQACGPAC